MNLHEYQGKLLFAKYNLPVSKGKVIFDAQDAEDACNEIGGSKWVVKAQVHAGGRGKSGGVELIDSAKSATRFAEEWLGNRLVTYQTDKKGQLVNSILIEECTSISKELYLSAVVDRDSQKIVFIGSSARNKSKLLAFIKQIPLACISETLSPSQYYYHSILN